MPRPLLVLAVAAPLILLSLSFDRPVAEWAFALLVVAFPAGLIALALARVRWPAVLIGLVLLANTAGLLALSHWGADAPRIWGLPPGAWLLLVGFGLLPLVLVTAIFAATYDRFGVSDDDLRRIRAMRRD